MKYMEKSEGGKFKLRYSVQIKVTNINVKNAYFL